VGVSVGVGVGKPVIRLQASSRIGVSKTALRNFTRLPLEAARMMDPHAAGFILRGLFAAARCGYCIAL